MRPTKLATPNSLSSLSNISIDFIDNKVLFRNLTPNEEFISFADEVEKVEEAAESQDIVKTAGLRWNIEICTYLLSVWGSFSTFNNTDGPLFSEWKSTYSKEML